MYIGGMGYPYNDDDALKEITDSLAKNIIYAYQNPPQNDQDRNKFITSQLVLNDIKYFQSISNLTNMQTATFTGADLLSLSTGLAATVFTPATTKTILAAITTTIIGYKGAIDDNIFHQQSANALISVMNSERKKVFLRIVDGMAKPTTNYTFVIAKNDLDDYASAGTPAKAFAVIGEKSKEDQAETEAKISKLVDPSSKACTTSTISKGIFITNCDK
jgi:hypothetical protein